MQSIQPYFQLALVLMLNLAASAQNIAPAPDSIDIGQQTIGQLKVSLIYGTNGDVTKAGKDLKAPTANQLKALKALKQIKFTHYKNLGEDKQPILRSYENWASPLPGSKEILLSYQPRELAKEGSLILDIEFWQSHKKIMKGGILLKTAKPLYIQGPDWRGGKLIIVVELVSLNGAVVAPSTKTITTTE